MRPVKTLGLLAIALAGFISGCSDRGEGKARAHEVSPQPIAAPQPSRSDLLDSIGRSVERSPKWAKLQAENTSSGGYRLTLKYRDMPSGMREVERDTRAIAQAALNSLVAAGRNPQSEQLAVSVWANRPEKGVTGADVVRMFGHARYNWLNDSIEFEPYR